MTAAAIKEYLGMVVDLEKEVYTQNGVIASLEEKLSYLPDARRYKKPVYSEIKPHYQPSGLALLCFGGAVLFLLLAPLSDAVINADFGLLALLLLPVLVVFYLARSCAIPCAVIAFVIGIIILLAEKSKETDARHEAKLQAKKSYETALAAYNQAVEQDKLRVQKELPRKTLLQKQLKEIKTANQKTKATLEKLYEKNIIHKNYRGLIPVCSLYGYFDTGVCTQLEGHEGAYNKYDTESRLDQIIVKMDQVIKHLEEIKEIQWMLYDAVEESNCKVGQLINSCEQLSSQLNGIQAQGAELNARVAQLQSTSDLNLYVNACTKRELEYMNRANRIF